MPIYDFYCKKCDVLIESFVGTKVTKINCPTCNSVAKRHISGFGSYTIKGDNSASVRPKTVVTRKGKNE